MEVLAVTVEVIAGGDFALVRQFAIVFLGEAAITPTGDGRTFGAAGAVRPMLQDLQIPGLIVGVDSRVIFQ
ncbi:hypothetical protein D3C87_1984380 [compost metagenome]